MKLALSNIGWTVQQDKDMYFRMMEYGFTGLEIAPTRIFPERPYDKLHQAVEWSKEIKAQYGFSIASMQSIWFGRSEKLYGTTQERNILLDYTKKAIDFAEVMGCKNLVFGCPRNRSVPEGADPSVAVDFFRKLGEYAYAHHTVIAMEANPPIYNTNFLNTTKDAVAFIEEVGSKGFLLNLDVGTMIENKETADVLKGKENLIHHVHISEPGLKPIQKRELHRELAYILRKAQYERFVSIETGRQENVGALAEMMDYVREIFG